MKIKEKRTLGEWAGEMMLAVIMVIAVVISLHYADRKAGLFCDEVYSYGLSNSMHYTFLIAESAMEYSEGSGWVDRDYFWDYLVVQRGEGFFHLKHVWQNQENDTLPPFYYTVLYWVCSCFPGTFSKWYGLTINFIAWFLSIFLLYRLTAKLLGSKYALFPCAAWSMSAACISMVTYIRMYALLVCILLAFLNVFANVILDHHRMTFRRGAGMTVLLWTGTLVHYYFAVYIFLLAACYLAFCLKKKNYAMCLRCGEVAEVSVIGALVTFPGIWTSHLNNYRMWETYATLGVDKMRGFLGQMHNMKQTFFGGSVWIVIFILFFLFGKFVYERIHKKELSEKELASWLFIAAAVGYIGIIMCIAPFADPAGNRYLYLVYPLLAFMMAFFIHMLPKRVILPLMLAVICWIGFRTVRDDNILFQYTEDRQIREIAAMDAGEDCVYLYDPYHWPDINQMIFNLMQYDEVCILNVEKIESITELLQHRKTQSEGLVIAYNDAIQEDDVKELNHTIMQMLGYDRAEYRYSEKSNVYSFSKVP